MIPGTRVRVRLTSVEDWTKEWWERLLGQVGTVEDGTRYSGFRDNDKAGPFVPVRFESLGLWLISVKDLDIVPTGPVIIKDTP